jgi:DNA-binding response OmpR family regulator
VQRRVLVVDDSPLILSALRSAFEATGFVVDTALSLGELEAHRGASTPDLILLDVQMPEAWGDDVAVTLRASYGVSVPILLMSSIDPEELAERAAEASVPWISKRGGMDKVVERVQHMLGASA